MSEKHLPKYPGEFEFQYNIRKSPEKMFSTMVNLLIALNLDLILLLSVTLLTKKRWHLGMNLHVGVDDESDLVHSMSTTAAKMHDLTASEELLHGEEDRVWADAGYEGIEKREEHRERQVSWHIALRPWKRKTLPKGGVDELMERCKASVRAKAGHVFFYVKRMFG